MPSTIARASTCNGDYQTALADFGEAIRFKPNDPEIYVDRGIMRSEHDDEARAIDGFTAATDRDPKVPLRYTTAAPSVLPSTKLKRAVADYDSAIGLASTFPDPFTNRGRI